jgi:uncharacterized protein
MQGRVAGGFVVIRGFLAGLISGGLLASVLAAVASLTTPLPPVAGPATDASAVAGEGAAAPVGTVAPPVVAAPATPQSGAAPVADAAPAAAGPQVAAVAPAAPALPAPQPGAAADPAGPAPVAPVPGPAGQVEAPAPAPAADAAPAPVAGPAPPGDPALLAPAPVPAPEASVAVPQAAGAGDAQPAQALPGAVPDAAAPADVPLPGGMAPVVPAPQAAAPEAATPEPAPQAEATPPGPAPDPAPDAAPAPEPALAATTPGMPVPALPGRPQAGLGASVEGVRTGRLPRIGDAASEAPPPAPEAGTETAAIPEDAPALRRNARAFENPEGKPPMAILLLDDPASGVDLAALASGPVALTLVIDPTAPDASARAALWRAAGQEVALLADALPARGRGSDYEVAMESLATAFPQALAVVETAGQPLPADRAGSLALIAALAGRGYGLVTRGAGLNALDQTARNAGLPAAAVYRVLDAEGEAAPVIGRYLDRIAFTAQQEGSVIVVGRLRPDTVSAVQDWAAGSSRAAALALAPVSALVQAATPPAP